MFGAIHTFGCLCFAHNQITHGDKLRVGDENVSLWDIRLGRKGGDYITLNPKFFFCVSGCEIY